MGCLFLLNPKSSMTGGTRPQEGQAWWWVFIGLASQGDCKWWLDVQLDGVQMSGPTQKHRCVAGPEQTWEIFHDVFRIYFARGQNVGLSKALNSNLWFVSYKSLIDGQSCMSVASSCWGHGHWRHLPTWPMEISSSRPLVCCSGLNWFSSLEFT